MQEDTRNFIFGFALPILVSAALIGWLSRLGAPDIELLGVGVLTAGYAVIYRRWARGR